MTTLLLLEEYARYFTEDVIYVVVAQDGTSHWGHILQGTTVVIDEREKIDHRGTDASQIGRPDSTRRCQRKVPTHEAALR